MDKYTVRDSSGVVDVAASANAYAVALTKWTAENEVAVSAIETAVEAAFDKHTARQPMDALLSAAVAEMNATPEQFKALTERCRAYVRGQAVIGRVLIVKGKGGGVERVARVGQPLPAKTA